MRVSVIGGSSVSETISQQAERVGELLAKRGHEVVCGGLGGVMEAVCRGARHHDGSTIGILPGSDQKTANPYVETAIATGMGNARNTLVVLNGDAAIAIDGRTGTLSEIGLALDYGRPVAALHSHDISGFEGYHQVDSPEEAISTVETRCQ